MMATFNIVCGGLGPHVPASGILGVSDRPQSADVRCPAAVCAPVPDAATVNRATLTGAAQNALANNQTFLGLSSPTNTQTAAQVQALTRQVNALIRLVLNQFDTTTGT